MNQPTPYQSQITYTKKGLEVNFRNRLKGNIQSLSLFLSIFLIVFGGLSMFLFAGFVPEEWIWRVFSGGFLSFLGGIIGYNVASSVVVPKSLIIENGNIHFKPFSPFLMKFSDTKVNHTKYVKYSPFFDFKIKILPKGVKVTFLDATFKLDSEKDLPILTDAIVELLDLTFYENYQLTDKTEILTYRGNRVVQPIFPSFLNIERTRQRIKCVDIIGGKHLITVDNFSTPSNKLWIGKRDRRVFTKDVKRITICFQPILWGFWSFIWIKVTLNYQVSSYKIIALLQKLLYQRFAMTGLRKRKDELTNIRDAQEIYSHLSLLDSLKRVEIVKR